MKIPPSNPHPQEIALDAGLSTLVEAKLREYFQALGDSKPASSLYEYIIHEVERPLISLVLEHVNGNRGKAAELLGINRNTLRKKLQEHNLL